MVNGKKLLAMILVFTMTFSNFAFATTGFVSLFGNNSDTGSKNVVFEAYLENGDEISNALVSDVNHENLAIKLQLDVKESGYLKNAKVQIGAKENEELNFVIPEDNKVKDLSNVQNLEENVLYLNKIDNSLEEMEILLPIQYNMEEYINESKLCQTAKVILSGIYVDDDGDENEISKEIELTLAWKDERAVKVENEISKYIQFGNGGVILQSIIKVDSTQENKNSLPTKETEVKIDVPNINGTKPNEVTVVANSTAGTNGKNVGDVQFNNDQWNYNQEENTVTIKVENHKELVDINQSEEYLKEENAEVKQEERYYSVAGMDEYVVTYTFQNAQLSDEMKIASKIDAKLTTFSGVQAEDNQNIATAEKAEEFVLTGQTGNIVSYNIENETKDVSKVYSYLENHETEYNAKTAINISYKDIVKEIIVEDVENYYINKEGNKVEADDMYYKQLSVSRENFNEILGEEGNIQILDVSGNVLTTLNKETQTDENGNYIINFQDRTSKIQIKTSAPVNTGNLIIASKKAVTNTSISKADFANIEYIATDTVQKAKFDYVTDIVSLGNCTTKTKLNDTTTNFNLIIDRDSLSTVTPNSNVEMRLELNNDEETSDIFGNSVFEIEMPDYVTGLNVTNASMIYGEGLDISKVEAFTREGKAVIQVAVDGKQTNLNSGVLTNGTNLVLNADITVDMYTPATDATFKAYCYNSEATNYETPTEHTMGEATVCDYQEATVEYSAPSGVVAINTITNYNETGSAITSVKQGEQVDYLDIYSPAKKANMEVVVVNNNDNAVSNLSILGKIPFKGVKDLATGEDLGTTLDTKLVSGILSNESNRGDFTVYYSENAEATKELTEVSNSWTQEPESFENIKAYLIVPKDETYKMEAKQVLKFNYEYEIPENLTHNESLYGTFLAYYTNNSEVATIDETSKPDKVGLTTGAGPELDLSVKTDAKQVKELEEFKTTFTIKNTGADVAKDIVVNIPVPSNTSFVTAEASRDGAQTQLADNTVQTHIESLEKDAEVAITVTLKVNNINEYETDKIEITATASAKDLQKEVTVKADEITIKRSELALEQFIDSQLAHENFEKGQTLTVVLYAQNLTDSDKKNVVVTTQLPKELEFSKAYMIEETSEGYQTIENATFDQATNKIAWKIDNISENSGKCLKVELVVGKMDSGLTEDAINISSQIIADDTENYNAQDVIINLGKNSLVVTQTSTTPTYVEFGKTIDYVFTINNEGSLNANNVVLTDMIPDGLMVTEVSYSLNGNDVVNTMAATETAQLELSVPANSQVVVNVEAIATNLDGSQEKTVTNEGTITGKNIEEVKSNSVTHIIQAKESDGEGQESVNQGGNTNNPTANQGDITKTYKITGTAWLDSNANGMRDDGEKRMENVTAMVVDSTSGVIKGTTTTNSNGEYTFAGLQNGSYLVLFKYDTVLYTTTTYRKEGVESSINSDAVATKIEQDGKKENGGVTDTIEIRGANVSNIDLGLVEAEQFSLQLDKAITKITVQNVQGTKTEKFDKTKLAKYDIAAKYLSGTTVYVEYTITAKNNGDLAGFASEIVDYIPAGMTFNSNLNPDWYTGTNGYLYTKALADSELAKGESKEITLVLTKQMTAENTGLVSNTAEISDDFNIYSVSDHNSKPGNKAQGEDDMATADTILTVKTGESLIYVSAIIVSLILGGAVAFVVYERVLKNKRKGGV